MEYDKTATNVLNVQDAATILDVEAPTVSVHASL